MNTLGIDLSSMPNGISACVITWEQGKAVVDAPVSRCDDSTLDALISEADLIGIDAPFGWPMDFVKAVAEWPFEEWNEEIRDRLRLRETDRFVHRQIHHQPLSVSSDRIALSAMRAMALLKRHGGTDRSGDGRFFEIYPAGSLAAWTLPFNGYKKTKEGLPVRKEILSSLCEQMPWLEASGVYAQNANDLDALIASLSVRAAAQGFTHLPGDKERTAARQRAGFTFRLSGRRCKAFALNF